MDSAVAETVTENVIESNPGGENRAWPSFFFDVCLFEMKVVFLLAHLIFGVISSCSLRQW